MLNEHISAEDGFLTISSAQALKLVFLYQKETSGNLSVVKVNRRQNTLADGKPTVLCSNISLVLLSSF